jgi:hypothetical protein
MGKPFRVNCSDCSFEREVESRERAQRAARGHSAETDHEVVAVELPPNRAA